MEFMERLLRQLQMTRENMTGYLLTESCLLLKPEFVFMDMESGEFFFLYFPYETEENYMLSFMEFLTDKVDVEDKEAVDICYKILQLLEKEQFVLDEVLQWFEEDYCGMEKDRQKTEPIQVRERTFETDDDLVNETEEERLPERAFPVSEKIIAGVMCAMVIGAGILFYLYQTCNFTQREWIYFYALSAGEINIILT